MHYLDNAATTKPSDKCVKKIISMLEDDFANPSSLYKLGVNAEIAVNNARKIVAGVLGCNENEITFTSCATESTNTVLFGAAKKFGKRKNHIVTTAVEHPATAKCVDELEKMGFAVTRVSPDLNGSFSAQSIVDAVTDKTFLVSCMLVNNETGCVLPVQEAFRKIKKLYPDCLTHCDAVQGFLKIPFKVKQLAADCVSLSGHKVHAAKGVGALYINSNVKLPPLLLGGGQERGFRSGTENTPLIAGFGEAVAELAPTTALRFEKVTALKNYLLDKLAGLNGVTVLSRPDASPYIVSLAVENIKSETLLHFLEEKQIYVSSGSACSKGKKSAVLLGFGVPPYIADSAVRVSFCAENTYDDINALVNEIKNAQLKLAKIKR